MKGLSTPSIGPYMQTHQSEGKVGSIHDSISETYVLGTCTQDDLSDAAIGTAKTDHEDPRIQQLEPGTAHL